MFRLLRRRCSCRAKVEWGIGKCQLWNKGVYTYVVLPFLLRDRNHACTAGWHIWFGVYDLYLCDADWHSTIETRSHILDVRVVSERMVVVSWKTMNSSWWWEEGGAVLVQMLKSIHSTRLRSFQFCCNVMLLTTAASKSASRWHIGLS